MYRNCRHRYREKAESIINRVRVSNWQTRAFVIVGLSDLQKFRLNYNKVLLFFWQTLLIEMREIDFFLFLIFCIKNFRIKKKKSFFRFQICKSVTEPVLENSKYP